MKALAVVDVGKFELQVIMRPTIKENEVLVEIAYVGICGSDLPRYFEGGVHQYPQILGHEFSGKITEVGSEVTTLKQGQRVAVAPLVPCGACEMCESGLPQLCPNYSFIGSRQPSAMAEYVAVPEKNCIVVPENLDLKVAATIEPLTVAIHGLERIKLKAGDRALVLGAGTIGLMTVLALKARGVGEIIVIDLNDFKLSKALEIGATTILNPLKVNLENYFNQHGFAEVVVETAGKSLSQVQAIKFAAKNAKVVLIGTSTENVTFSPGEFELILRRELTITGSWMSYSAPFPGFEWHAAVNYLANGVIDTRPLITGIYSLEDKAIPFENMRKSDSKEIKALYEIRGGK